jgi:K+-sensing histidine kinase KdpD
MQSLQMKITVSVHMLKAEFHSIEIEFSVTDTGIGIPESKLEHIFDDFQQQFNETSQITWRYRATSTVTIC